MEIHQLTYFCAVALTGSFTKAAAQEGIAQPSLSQQIDRLEKALGVRLFDRLGRGVRLTEAGQLLLPKAIEILRMVHGARNQVASLREGVAGRLAVGCIPTIMPYFLAPRLNEFTRRFPSVEVRLIEDITPSLVSLLQTGEIDVAVVSPPLNKPGLVCSDLFREPILVAMSKQHKLAHAEKVDLGVLSSEKLLLLKEGHCFRDNALTVCSRNAAGFVSVFETHQFSSIMPLVAAGFGISLVPRMAAHSHDGCVFRELDREAYRRVGYVRVRQHDFGPAQKSFVSWLRELAGPLRPATRYTLSGTTNGTR